MTISTRSAHVWAIFIKELIQMRRDRLTFAVMLAIPAIQLILFGFAINSDPKHLPTAVVAEEQTPMVRSLVQALQTSGYFALVQNANPIETEGLLARGEVTFVVTIPIGFTRRLENGRNAQLLVEADATDPATASGAIASLNTLVNRVLSEEFRGKIAQNLVNQPSIDVVIHRRYNPRGITQYNIVPGLLGVILTMTLVMITGIAMTREVERGTMENLLAMPVQPAEVMIGKISPYVLVGGVQTLVVLLAAHWVFAVPFIGDLGLLLLGVLLFIVANLALGFTFSTLARTQMQAMQLTFFFFLPSILLSGFMFPFRGMPTWAQLMGEALPLTHFLRIVRGVMLKGAGFADIQMDLFAIVLFTVVVAVIARLSYRRTLD